MFVVLPQSFKISFKTSVKVQQCKITKIKDKIVLKSKIF
jgi:hypothetical protein